MLCLRMRDDAHSSDMLDPRAMALETEMALDPPIAEPLRQAAPCSRVWHTLREAFLADKPGLTEKTLWSYNQAFGIWQNLIGDKAVAEIRRADLKLFADHLRDKPSARGGRLNQKSIERSLGHIKTFMAWMHLCFCG